MSQSATSPAIAETHKTSIDHPESIHSSAFREVDWTTLETEQAAHELIRHAAEIGSSDLFFLSGDDHVEVSARRLGSMESLATMPKRKGCQIISSVKALAGMDISQRRRPLDGRHVIREDDCHLDLRINTIPTLSGEDMTIRLWDRSQQLRKIADLGMTSDQISKFRAMLDLPSGLILVTGPTGVGKTSTLYAALDYLSDGETKINTLEDPIEYSLPGVRQSQIDAKIGVGFAELLPHVLRQAPDVIMIGEIRDEATASTAVRAANSGHLVLATLHAPFAADAVRSMLSLGSHPYFLSNCLLGVVSQRLLRTLCPNCKQPFSIGAIPQIFDDIRSQLTDTQGEEIFAAAGCASCHGSGYNSRTGLFEIMSFDTELRRMMSHVDSSEQIHAQAIRGGMIDFRRGALMKVAQGITSTEEILRVIPSDLLNGQQS